MYQVQCSVFKSTVQHLTIDRTQVAYGTGKYRYQLIEDEQHNEYSTSHCVSLDGKHKWIEHQYNDKPIVHIFIVQGDTQVIQQLVKNEIDHFDSEVIFV